MLSPSHPVLQKLYSLDRSLSGFHNQLSNVLYGEEYTRCVANLQGDDLVWLVDYLDNVLDDLTPFSPAFRKCLRGLRSICKTRAILPTSYTLSADLLRVDSDPFASGGFGDVYHGTFNGSRVCVKRVRVYLKEDPKKAAKTFCVEAVMWKRLKHPNIVPLLGITITPFQLISNWMPGGDLLDNVKNANTNRLGLVSDVAEGLCYLHSYNLIHGDLKGENILVDDSGHARITDFGLAMVTQNLDSVLSTSSRHGNTPRWSAPEVLREGKFSKEADIFSFAMVMIEAFTGAIPFSEKQSGAAMFEIMVGLRPQRPTHPTFTDKLWILMQNCWNQDPRLRPAVSEVLSALRGIDCPAWKRLISDTLAIHERISLITVIFSDHNQVKMVGNLSGDDAQAFVDKIDEVLDSLAPQIHRRCLRYLYRICDHQALLPKSLAIPLCYDQKEDPVYHGRLADVWEGQHQSRKVAAQVLRLLPGDDTKQIRGRFCREVVTWKALYHPNVLPLFGVTITKNQLVMVSEWMTRGNIREFTKADVNADRLALLRGVTRGLVYIHDQGVIHGDLKGVNILIDNDGNARLTGSNLITIASGQSMKTFPEMAGTTIPWMSPELLYPQKFGLEGSYPTKESDCYALGMVIYEVLSGQAPFASYRDPEVVYMVLGGERPKRPQGDEGELFTDDIWEVLELCWKPLPSDRISAKGVLMGLDGSLSPSGSPSDMDGDEIDIGDRSDDTQSGSGLPIACGSDELPGSLRPDIPKGGSFSNVLVRKARRLFRLRQARR
ncbi:kinase-like protein [Thelephora ganbajun]|uniref:Kinase-like protein n=1 Tax=Thelephora ganbajun TaxID=370292 RepID=A0ACB6Z5S2_THEGA|nr:kinase-like protein [Thelephora ganbajun]